MNHFCEFILILDQSFRRFHEDISYLELCQPLFPHSKIVCAILVEGIMNISVKLFLIWTSGSGDVI